MWIKEWNISYCIDDEFGGLDEYMVVLPKFWKVVWWLIKRCRKCCEFYVWTTMRNIDEGGLFPEDA